MAIQGWRIYIGASKDYIPGEWVKYEEHLVELAKLEHIIAGANAEILRLAEENTALDQELQRVSIQRQLLEDKLGQINWISDV